MPSALNKITQPFLYEINTWPWLAAISHDEGRAIDLGSVPIATGMNSRSWFRRRVVDGCLAAKSRWHRDRAVQ